MAMGRKERKELVSATISQLEEVLPASGKPEELVKLTTAIVQSAKKLLDGTPDDLRTKSTAALSEFVVAARIIAKNPRSVDASARQALSSSRRAVDGLVRELDSWHDAKQGDKAAGEDAEVVLKRLASEAVLGGSLSVTRQPPGNGGAVTGLSGPGQSQENGKKEKELRAVLKREQIKLWKKTEPQQAPNQHGRPSEALTTATGNLQKATRGLVDVASQKTAFPMELLEPALQLIESVSVLLDLVDSLFVSRYPMRSQVHGFCCTLVENALSFGSQSRTDDASSLRTITTEVPALLSAADVMITQCHKRAQDMEGQKKMSMQRSSNLQILNSMQGMGMGVKKRSAPPKPPVVEQKETEFEVICVLCTNVAVKQEDKKPMPKGTELPLLAYSSTSILDVKRMLQTRTGLSRDSIEIKMQGDDVLPDSTRVKPNNVIPYFVFNIHEPNEVELLEMRKMEKKKNRPKLQDVRWSQYSGDVAIALYDYAALGEEGNLNFDEGDIIEIIEKSHDGWWTGKIDETVGDFPASFVEEIDIPRTKEERKRLSHRFKRTSPDKVMEADVHSLQEEGRASPAHLKKFRKFQSNPEPSSPTTKAKFDRRVSEPVFSQFELGAKKEKKKLGIFKKRGTQYGPVQEEPSEQLPKPRSPLLSSSDQRKKKVITNSMSWENATARSQSPEPLKKPLVKPMVSPKVSKRKQSGGVLPRRPPPPVPKPLQATHVSIDTEELARRASDELSPEREGESGVESAGRKLSNPQSPPTESSKSPELLQSDVFERESSADVVKSLSPDSVKKSESMEELLKNLEEFDEVISSQNGPESPENEERERDFATIPRSELPIKKMPGIQLMDENRQVKSLTNTPEATRKLKPARPKSVQNGLSHSQPDEPVLPKPKAPPRRKKNKMSQKLQERLGIFESSESGSDAPAKPAKPTVALKPARLAPNAPPPKPERDEKKRMWSRLEIMAERQACSSAPVSRNVSPDSGENKLDKEASVSTEGLNPNSPALAKCSSSPPSPLSYEAALKCISFLSEEDRVANHQLFLSTNGSSESVDAWLSALDKGEAADLSTLQDSATAEAMLKALISNSRLGPLIPYPLAKAMGELVKSATPVSVLGSLLEQLTPQHRGLLKELLRLFGLVINHSHKNRTDVSDLNRLFGASLFDRLSPAQTEPLLAYLISTCELIIL